eukprot:TRINITY_DN635_c0_g1_i7.p3 TRINITY_DN635_c0_g1~~TRINITY_DN635_c0_g1_i7.p3  ORF type:complete len:108 (-),score=16.92 TRINITY_DN635_c0_g1_i7:131-454(-)
MQLVVSQQSFDDAVQDNIEALGMSEEEAIQGVIEEFKLQGADLSGVVTAVGAKQLIQQHPLLKLAEQLASLIEQENAGKKRLNNELFVKNRDLSLIDRRFKHINRYL